MGGEATVIMRVKGLRRVQGIRQTREQQRTPVKADQAKGRVERLFTPVQDRLSTARRLAGDSTWDAANQFLKGYLPSSNRRFAVQPIQATDRHRPRPASCDLDRILCIKTTRCLRRDWTVAHHGHLDQVQTNIRATHVMVEDRVDGTMRMTHKGRPLTYQAIVARPWRAPTPRKIAFSQRPVTPTRASVARAPATGAKHTGDGGENIARIVLRWEKEGISQLG